MKLMKQLRRHDQFSDSEKSIVKYLLENRGEVSELSARQLAERAFTSSATVVRFCQRLGFKGYADFKVRFVAESMQTNLDGEGRSITNKDTVLSVIEKVTSIETDALQETKTDLDPAAVVRAVYKLEKAVSVDFYAADNNLHVADIASYALLHVGKFSTVHHTFTSMYLQAMSSNHECLGVLISRTGENRKLVEIAQVLKKRRTPIVLLTAEKDTTLVRMSDVVLWVATEHKFNELENFVFLTGAKFLIDILFSMLMTHHYDAAVAQNKLYGRIFSKSN